MGVLRSSPENAASLFADVFYFFQRPHQCFGPNAPLPPPPTESDFEVIEESVSIFDNMIYNETGGGNDGRVIITQS